MKSANSRINLLKEAINIEEQRSVLQSKLNDMASRLSAIHRELFANKADGSGASLHATPVGRRRKARAPRGALKAQVLRALAASGSAGVRVVDLAASLGSKPANIHSWFQDAKKRLRMIKRVGAGHYRLVGALPASELKGPKTSAATDSGRTRRTGLSKRGKLTEAIFAAFKAAGKGGVRVGELSKKFRLPVRNLFVWFATTGKKFKGIKKIAPGQYRFAG